MKRIQSVFARFILLADINPTVFEKTKYTLWVLAHAAPIIFMMDWIKVWFQNNGQFFMFACVALIVNMAVGIWFHLKFKTFKIKEFLLKNAEMMGVMVVVYVMLEMMRYTAGENLAGEIFRVFVQILSLMYPASKVFKNIFIISNRKHPPEFIMTRLYNFEKYGDLEGFFKTTSDKESNHKKGENYNDEKLAEDDSH